MSYGFQVFDAAGGIVYGETQTGTRLVYSQAIAANFSGVISVPGFDSAKGVINVVFAAHMQAVGVNTRPFVNMSSHPTLVWDNAAKTLTVTAEAVSYQPHLLIPSYRVGFYHNS